ncbi:hypothetical protein UI24_01995 [Mycobacteroides franklinii]|nr:hypothetical protein [Mycobacteroides franklinii]
MSPDSCSDCAHTDSCGGITGGGGSLGPRSLITMVPAKISPRRLPFDDTMLVITAGAPMNMKISTTAANARMMACRSRSGPPSSDTTRSPMAILPRERPRVDISQMTG